MSIASQSEERILTIPVYLRERKTSVNFSPSNLFGQPFLIGVPAQTTYKQLYEVMLTRLSRYVNSPKSEDEWWNNPTSVDNEEKSNSDKKDGQTKQEIDEIANSTSSALVSSQPETEADDDLMMAEEDNGKGPPFLFEMNIVNSYGNAQLEQLENDGTPLNLSGN